MVGLPIALGASAISGQGLHRCCLQSLQTPRIAPLVLPSRLRWGHFHDVTPREVSALV